MSASTGGFRRGSRVGCARLLLCLSKVHSPCLSCQGVDSIHWSKSKRAVYAAASFLLVEEEQQQCSQQQEHSVLTTAGARTYEQQQQRFQHAKPCISSCATPWGQAFTRVAAVKHLPLTRRGNAASPLHQKTNKHSCLEVLLIIKLLGRRLLVVLLMGTAFVPREVMPAADALLVLLCLPLHACLGICASLLSTHPFV